MQYNSKKAAVKAAIEQSLDSKSVYELDGKWVIGTPANENIDPAVADVIVDQPSPWAETTVTEEEHTIYWPSDASTPFGIIWNFLALNPWMTRKAQVVALTAYGLNENTVRTQVSRFHKWNGDKSALLANEKAKRDAEREHIAALVKEIQKKNALEAIDALKSDEVTSE